MKVLLVFPPLWDFNLGPMLSLPLLSGMLKEQGHEVKILDLNSSYTNFILSKDFIGYCNARRTKLISDMQNFRPTDMNTAVQGLFLRQEYDSLQKIYRSGLFEYIEKYPDAKNMFNNLYKENKKPADFEKHFKKLKDEVYNLSFNSFQNKIPHHLTLFYRWEQDVIMEQIREFNPDLIGFSVYCVMQHYWCLRFISELKKQINPIVVLGGTEISQSRESVTPETFDKGVDAIIYGEGEEAFKALAANKKFSEVPNIIYKDEQGRVRKNDVVMPVKFNFYKPNYEGIDLDKYFVPKPVLQIESSRGCYWHKCEFCTFMDCSTYKIKNVDVLIEEIKEYVNKYNIHHFFFTDAAIHPEYAREFSKKLIENKLKIYYITFLRLEKEFDAELLKLMYKGGLRIAMWGVESGSDRILGLYNKGTLAKDNAKILKTAHKEGIYNYCWLIYNFPREEIVDIELTKKFLLKNYDSIDYVSFHTFTIMPTAPISKKRQEYGLEKYEFKKVELYEPPEAIAMFSAMAKQTVTAAYQSKFEKYPTELSYTLIKLSEERP